MSLEKGELPEAVRARGDRLDHMGAAAAQLQLSPARRGHCWHVQREEFKRSRLPAAKRSRARLGRCGRFLASKDCLYHAEYAGHTLTCSTLKIQPRRRPAWSGGGGVARERCVRRKLERYSGPGCPGPLACARRTRVHPGACVQCVLAACLRLRACVQAHGALTSEREVDVVVPAALISTA